MTVDQILILAVKAIKAKMPEAIYAGHIVKSVKSFNASTSVASDTETDLTPVEIILDTFKSEELLGSNILSTDVKMYVIATDVKSIDFYTSVKIYGFNYRIKQIVQSVIGSKTAMFTIAATND